MTIRSTTPALLVAAVLHGLAASAPAEAPDAHWSFDGATVDGRLTESYGRSQLDAIEVVGASSWNTRSGFGEVLANGTNSPYLSAPNGPDFDVGSGNFSLSIWSYRTSDSSATSGLVDALNGTGVGFQWFYQADNTIRLRLDDDAGHAVIPTTTGSHLALNTWQNLIVTVDRTADRVRFYVDAAEVAPLGGIDISPITGRISPDQDFHIGTLNTGSPARGRLDDLALFKRVLSPTDIAAINANGGTPTLSVWPPPPPPPTVTFDPPAGLLRSGETVTLASEPAGHPVRFTTDGSDPDEFSVLYLTPIQLAESAMIRARAFDGATPGPVASANYLLLPDEPPNILLIIADDLGFNDLGCYGAVSVATPRLDALAYSGQRLTQCTTAGPGDLTSQYALLTGRLARRAGLPGSLPSGLPGLDTREWTLAEALRKAGYQTGLVGSWHLGDTSGSLPQDQGFRTVHGLPADLTTLTSQARTFLTDHAAERFFLLFQPPAQAATGSSLLGSYGNQVEAFDSAVGMLLDDLDTLGIADETLVVFLSDSGTDRNTGSFPTGSNGQLRDGKGTTWEGGVRVPCITRWPGVVPVSDNFATLWLPDIHNSLADIAGAYLPDDRPLDGTARGDVLLGARTKPDDHSVLFLHRHDGADYTLRALRSGEWKLHLAYNNSDPGNPVSTAAPLLYDLLVDPIEHVNRAGEQTSILAKLQQLASDHEATFSTPVPQLPAAKPPVHGKISTTILRITPGPGTAAFAYTRPADSLDDHYPVEHSNDMASWNEIPSAPFVTSSVIHADGTENVTLEVPLDHPDFSPPNHFIRLKASRP